MNADYYSYKTNENFLDYEFYSDGPKGREHAFKNPPIPDGIKQISCKDRTSFLYFWIFQKWRMATTAEWQELRALYCFQEKIVNLLKKKQST